jgi:hypothetical protein
MPHQLVFITLFLGLISGRREVDLQAGPAIKSIRILLDGKQVAELQKEPWSAIVDFGPLITPGELVAAGYDGNGKEVARESQLVNLPHLTAEFVIVLRHDEKGTPASVELRWKHLFGSVPLTSSLVVDGEKVPLDSALRATLPRLDMGKLHVIAATISFQDGVVARRELVVGGASGETAETQLTPIAVRASTDSIPHPDSHCFRNAEAPVRVAAIEKSPGLVIFVLDPDQEATLKALDPARGLGTKANEMLVKMIALDRGTSMHVQWTVAEKPRTTSHSSSSVLFPATEDLEAGDTGLVWFLTRISGNHEDDATPRQAADAVVVAGLNAMKGARRRAVVLVLSRHNDASSYGGAVSRRYLSSIGVPLFVWSLDGARPELREVWGDIDDVSSLSGLRVAADRLRAELASQRVAWVAADPVNALRIQSTGKCGLTPLAQSSR